MGAARTDTNEGAEHVVHQAHEGSGGVGEAEGTHGELKAAEVGVEGGLVHVRRIQAGLVVTRPDVM